MVALTIPGSALSTSLAQDPCALLDLLADLAVLVRHQHLRLDRVAGCHDGDSHLAVPGFLRDLAQALNDICPAD